MAASNKRPSGRVPTKLFPSVMGDIKKRYLQNKKRDSQSDADLPLKAFVRVEGAKDPAFAEIARQWLHNKRANTSKPELCIGSTRKKKNKDGKKP